MANLLNQEPAVGLEPTLSALRERRPTRRAAPASLSVARAGLEPARHGGHGLLRAACLPFHHLAVTSPSPQPLPPEAGERGFPSGSDGNRTHEVSLHVGFTDRLVSQDASDPRQYPGWDSNPRSPP